MPLNRREWIGSTVAFAAAATPQETRAAAPKNTVISSGGDLRPVTKAMELLNAGADTLDAVIAGVNIMEEDPEVTSIGYGGLPNEDGVTELDASVMHGPTRRCGSVAGIRNVKTPSKIAKLVMEQTDHIMLVGEGALRFAKDYGFQEYGITDKARLAWLVWKQGLKDRNNHSNWGVGLDAPPGKTTAALERLKQLFPKVKEEELLWAMDVAVHPPTGTINCLSLNAKGEMSGCTTTSGLAWKIAGRAGDSPIIGAGLYVDQETGAAGSTGRGEENIRICGGHTIVENMRHGMTPKDAIMDALKRIARNFDNDRVRLEKIGIQFYALRNDGEFAGGALWSAAKGANPPSFCVNDGAGSRRVPCATLLQR